MIAHGFTVERSGEDALDNVQQRVQKALDIIAGKAVTSQLTDRVKYVDVGAQHLPNNGRSADIGSATAIAPPSNYAHITGAVQVDYIAISSTFDGFRIDLLVINGLTFRHNVGAPPTGAYALQTLTAANVAKAANGIIAFRRDDALKRWVQVA